MNITNEELKKVLSEYKKTNDKSGVESLLKQMSRTNIPTDDSGDYFLFLNSVAEIAKKNNHKDISTYCQQISEQMKKTTGTNFTYTSTLETSLSNRNDCKKLLKESLKSGVYDVAFVKIIEYITKKRDKQLLYEILELLDKINIDNTEKERNEIINDFVSKINIENIFGKTSSKDYYIKQYKKLSRKYVGRSKKEQWSLLKKIGIGVITILVLAGLLTGILVPLSRSYYCADIKTEDLVIEYGEALDLSNFVAYKKNKLNKTIIEPITIVNIKYDKNKIGEQNATVSYLGYEKEFKITINRKEIADIKVTFDRDRIMWDSISEAKSYIVIINGEEYSTENNYYNFNFDMDVTNYVIQVKAIVDEKYYISNGFSEELVAPKMAAPSSVWYNDGYIYWESVAGAKEYNLKIGEGANCESYIVRDNKFAYSKFKAGENVIRIQAVSQKNDIVSSKFSKLVLTKLDVVKNVKYENSKIVWEKSTYDNVEYKVCINNGFITTRNNYIEYVLAPNESLQVSIVVVSLDGSLINSDELKTEVIYKKLAPVSDIQIKDLGFDSSFEIKWGQVSHADKYDVTIELVDNSGEIIKDTLQLSDLSLRFFKNENTVKIVVRIKAIDSTGNYENSEEVVKEYII